MQKRYEKYIRLSSEAAFQNSSQVSFIGEVLYEDSMQPSWEISTDYAKKGYMDCSY